MTARIHALYRELSLADGASPEPLPLRQSAAVRPICRSQVRERYSAGTGAFMSGRRHTSTNKWGSPMNEKPQNLQDTFLNAVRKSKTAVTIYLVNGVKLQGNITWFDNFCVLLRRDGQVQLVYKHAISTVMPMGPIQLQEQDAGRGEA